MLTIVKLVLGVADKLLGYVEDRQLINAGEAQNARRALQEARNALERARATADRVRNDSDYRERVRDRHSDDG